MKSLPLLVALAALLTLEAHAQFKYTFVSKPDSAMVMMNGKFIGVTPSVAKFYWKDAKGGAIVFDVKADGYKTWSDTLKSKPREFNKLKTALLDLDIPQYDLPANSPIVLYDRLVADFREGTKVGQYTNSYGQVRALNWEGSVKVGDSGFERRFYEITTSAGINTAYKKATEIFSDKSESRKMPLPRYVIGARLLEYRLDLTTLKKSIDGAGSLTGRTTVKIEWQVLDKMSDKVVLTHANTVTAKDRQRGVRMSGDNMAAFELSLSNFLRNSGLEELLANSPAGVSAYAASPDSTMEATAIKNPKLPAFKSASEMIKHSSSACVTIITDGGHGSGALISSDGYILSAYHVVEGVNKIEVQFGSGLKLEGTIVAYDKPHDVVLIRIPGSGYTALPLALQSEVELGDELLTIGTPAKVNLGQSISKGILSGKRLENERVYLQVNMSVSPGNSGGPLLTEHGEIVGIIQSKIIREGIEGIGFALPVAKAVERLNLVVQ